MSETVKKAAAKPKAPAKPRKTATKKTANGAASNVTEMPMPVPHEQVAELAHKLWIEGGHQHGQDAEHWFRAEQLLRSKAS